MDIIVVWDIDRRNRSIFNFQRKIKIMRRILKKIASGDVTDLGDTTTLADPTVVQTLVSERQ